MFPPDHWLNAYLSYDDENIAQASLFGTDELIRARAIGTFSYIGGFVTFLTVILYLAIALIGNAKWKTKRNYWIFVLAIATVGAMFTTGSRTPIYGLVITAPVLLWIWAIRGLISAQQGLRIIGLGAVLMLILLVISPAAIDAFSARAGTSSDTIERMFSPFVELYGAYQTSPIFGIGIGSAHSAASTIMQTVDYWWLGGNVFEVETARVLQETGIIGFMLVYGCRLWLLAAAIGLAKRFRTPLYIFLSSVIAGFFVQSLYLFVINNPTAGIYYWFCAGVLFAMCRLESKALSARRGNVMRDLTKQKARTAGVT
jgi:O-antigen ligase